MRTTCHADKKVSAPMNAALLAAFLWNSAAFSQAEEAAPEVVAQSTNTAAATEAKKSRLLPDLDTLVNAKLDALHRLRPEEASAESWDRIEGRFLLPEGHHVLPTEAGEDDG